jgi:hypothetical protein
LTHVSGALGAGREFVRRVVEAEQGQVVRWATATVLGRVVAQQQRRPLDRPAAGGLVCALGVRLMCEH